MMHRAENTMQGGIDTMMNRGEFLRSLRKLAQEDEAQRETYSHECFDNNVLSYNSYLSVQAVYDDYKHVNYRQIDFGIVGDSPLVVNQDRNVGKGGFVWDSGFILAEHVANEKEWQWGNPSVVELGAGTGITGLYVARQVPSATVHLTDLPQLLPLLEKNASGSKNVTTGVLEWGRNVTGQFDVILGADVVASIYDSFALAETIFKLSSENTKIYLACEDRLAGSIEAFEGHMKKMFDHVERSKPTSSNKNPKVWIFHAHGKRQNQ
jgi:predicted nicotinamide N-methyase